MQRSTFLAASAALSAAALPQSGFAQTPPLNLRVAANANDTYASPFYAQDEGFFTRAGLNVDLRTMGNGSLMASAVIAGDIDIGETVPIALANAYLHNLPLVIVAAGSISVPTAPAIRLCVSKTSTLKTAKDIEGKAVAINALGVGLDLSLHAWITSSGADWSKVKLIEIPFSEMGAALDRGTADAAVMAEPGYTVALKQYGTVSLVSLDTVVGAPYLISSWFTTRDFADKHPEELARFSRAIYATQKWANTHKPETAVILAKYSKLDIGVVRTMTRCVWADQLRANDIQVYLDLAAKYGALPHPVQTSSFIYTRTTT